MTEFANTSLLLAAFPPELGDLATQPPAGWQTACVGVGLARAAAATARLIATYSPEKVLFIGTCGAYNADLRIGDCIAASEVRVLSGEELQGGAYRPAPEPTLWPASLSLPFPAHTVVNPPAITCTAQGAEMLGAHGAVEHLELAGVFEAAQAARLPVGAVLGIANRVGPHAHQEWRNHHEAVSCRLITLLRERGVIP